MALCLNNIWEEFSLPLKKFINRRISDEQDAEDILQEVFIKIHNNMANLLDDHKIGSWVYTITRNTIIDYYRKHDKIIELFELPEELAVEPDQDLSSNKEIAACLNALINYLPANLQEAIILTEFQNLTQKEYSQKVGLSISGAKSRVKRARKKLKEMLSGCCELELDRYGNIIDYQHKSNECKYCKQ